MEQYREGYGVFFRGGVVLEAMSHLLDDQSSDPRSWISFHEEGENLLFYFSSRS